METECLLMRTATRSSVRSLLAGWLVATGLALALSASSASAAAPPEKILPDSTLGFLKVKNAAVAQTYFDTLFTPVIRGLLV